MRTILTKDGIDVGTVHLDIGFRGDADVLLLCLYDEGSFVNALTLLKNRGNEYVRVGSVHVESKTGTKIEEWELKTISLS
jgi:hypothetical protein